MLLIIVPAIGQNSLRVVQECEEAKEVCDRLHERYAGKCFNNKLTVLRNLLKMKYTKNKVWGIK